MKKVILVSIDGMRPDGALKCGNPFVQELMKRGSYALDAQTVMPSVTLPCHMSMFHSVTPERHGITTNTYIPQVRPIRGLCEQISAAGGRNALFYGWEPMRDVARPGSATWGGYIWSYADDAVDGIVTDKALMCIETYHPDFVYIYMPETDDKGGHDTGWMSETYLKQVAAAIGNVKRVVEAFGDEYTVIVTADHGGHDRTRGTDLPEDMTIPMFFIGKEFEAGKALENVSILDIAPTIAKIMGVPAPREWEGRALV